MEETPKKARPATQVVGPASVNVGQAVSDTVINIGRSNVAVNAHGIVAGRDISTAHYPKNRVLSEDQAFERIGAAVKMNLEQLEQNIAQARKESNQFFKLTLVFSALGFLVVLAAIGLMLSGQVLAGIVSAAAGVIPEVTAALFFAKDKELRGTIERYHQHVLDSQKLLTMIDVAETVQNESERDMVKRQIIYNALEIDTSEAN